MNNLSVPHTAAQLWIFLAILSAGFSSIICSLGYVIKKAYTKGKPLVLKVPEVPGLKGKFQRRRFVKGTFTEKLEGSEGLNERIIAQDSICIPTNWGPLWLIGASTGWNLIAPTKSDKPQRFDAKRREAGKPADTATDEVFARMLVSDPLAYEQAIENNDFADFVNSKQEKDPWQVRIAGLVIFALLFALVSAGGVLYLVVKAHQGA